MIRLIAIVAIATAAIAIADASPRRQSTSRRNLRPIPQATAPQPRSTEQIPDDTLATTDGIEIAGYNKPANASKETFFIVNHTDRTITGLTVTFIYTDMQSRQLHKATHTIRCDIPPQETRLATVPTWDPQHTFHYHLTPPPRKHTTPYTLTHRIDRVLALPLSPSL